MAKRLTSSEILPRMEDRSWMRTAYARREIHCNKARHAGRGEGVSFWCASLHVHVSVHACALSSAHGKHLCLRSATLRPI